jgi:hypothetical protein
LMGGGNAKLKVGTKREVPEEHLPLCTLYSATFEDENKAILLYQ